jgi:hypothetical protein
MSGPIRICNWQFGVSGIEAMNAPGRGLVSGAILVRFGAEGKCLVLKLGGLHVDVIDHLILK